MLSLAAIGLSDSYDIIANLQKEMATEYNIAYVFTVPFKLFQQINNQVLLQY